MHDLVLVRKMLHDHPDLLLGLGVALEVALGRQTVFLVLAVLRHHHDRPRIGRLKAEHHGWREGQFRPCDQYGEVLGIIDDSDVSYNDTCDDCMELLDPSGQARWEQAFIDDARRDGLREIPFTVPMELEGYGEESWEHLHNAWMEGLEEDMSTDYGMHLWSVARGYTTHA